MVKQTTNSKIGKASPVRALPWKLKSVSRTRQDILSWNRSLNMAQFAEEPRMWPLQLLYNEIRTDALLTALIENRFQQLASSNASLKTADGDEHEEATAIMRNLRAYSKINRSIFESNNHGNSVIEFSLHPDKQLDMVEIPRTNIVPQKGLFYADYTDDTNPIKYRELKEYGTWVLEFDSGTLGLLNKAVPHVLYKRFAQSCHSELCEIYGIPPRVLKTNTQDSTMLSRGEQMMKDMGAAAYFIIDETETLEFAQGVGTNGDVYTNLQNFCNSEISMLFNGAVIGQDTKNGNRSKDESGQEMLWLLVQSDMRMIEQVWNHTVLPALVNLGILPAGLRFEYEEAEDTNKLFEFTEKLLTHYDIKPEWIFDKFGVEVMEKVKVPEPDKQPEPEPEDPAKKKKGEKLSFFPTASTVIGANHLCCNHLTLAALPSNQWSDDGLIQRFWDAEGELSFDIGLFFYTANTLLKGFKQGWKEDIKLAAMGLEYGKDDPAMLTAYEMNLFRFSAAKTLAEAQELNRLFRDATSFEQFYKNAKLKLDVFNKSWLETEYNNAIAVGAASSTYHRLMGNSKVFPYWQYKTVQDDAVRPEHQLLHDIILPYNDPRWKLIFPPNGWKCRCFVIAKMKHEATSEDFKRSRELVDAYLDGAEYAKAKAQGWGVNRSESGEVFTANQQYINKFPTHGSREINALLPQQWGLDSYAKRVKQATKEQPVFDKTAKEWFDALDERDGLKVVKDYKNRPLTVTVKDFDKHTNPKSSKYKERSQLIEAAMESLKDPDEVYLNGNELSTLVYIKFYKDKAIAVNVQTDKGTGLRLLSWFKLTAAKQTLNKWRAGLLINFKK